MSGTDSRRDRGRRRPPRQSGLPRRPPRADRVDVLGRAVAQRPLALLWALVVFFAPLLGVVLYLILGRR